MIIWDHIKYMGRFLINILDNFPNPAIERMFDNDVVSFFKMVIHIAIGRKTIAWTSPNSGDFSQDKSAFVTVVQVHCFDHSVKIMTPFSPLTNVFLSVLICDPVPNGLVVPLPWQLNYGFHVICLWEQRARVSCHTSPHSACVFIHSVLLLWSGTRTLCDTAGKA